MKSKEEEINYGITAISGYLAILKPQKKWNIYYDVAKENHNFSDWDRQYHGIIDGEEYFFVYDNNHLLYVINVTGDSTLTAMSELMELLARKF